MYFKLLRALLLCLFLTNVAFAQNSGIPIIGNNIQCNDDIGNIVLSVKAGENASYEDYKLQEYYSPYACQFEELVNLPDDIQRTTVIYDWSCSMSCPEYVTVNNQIIRTKELLEQYYGGEPGAGSYLCDLLESDSEALKYCLVANFDERLIAGQSQIGMLGTVASPTPISVSTLATPVTSVSTLATPVTSATPAIIATPTTNPPPSMPTLPDCESTAPIITGPIPLCGGICPLSENGKQQNCSFFPDGKCKCEEIANSPCKVVGALQCGGECPTGQSCTAGYDQLNLVKCDCTCLPEINGNYLLPKDRDNLTNKWQVWNDKCKRADNFIAYTASKQNQQTTLNLPYSIELDITVDKNKKMKFKKHFGPDIVGKNIVIDNEQALKDLAGNVYPDYETGKNSGTFPYEFSFKSGDRIIEKFKPFYHGTFLSAFTSGLGYYSKKLILPGATSLDSVFSSLQTDWLGYRFKFFKGIARGWHFQFAPQDPSRSPWTVEPELNLTTSKPANHIRYAILLEGKGEASTEPEDKGFNLEQYLFHNDIEFMKYILTTIYGFDKNKIYSLNKGDVKDFKKTFNTIANDAAVLKVADNKTKVQVVIYYSAHGLAKLTEAGIDNSLKDKEGAKRFEMWFEDGSITEDDLKSWTKELFFTPLGKNNFNSVDQVFFIPEACYSGASVI